jgi:hypothetical protein
MALGLDISLFTTTNKLPCNLHPMLKRQVHTPTNKRITTKSQTDRQCYCVELPCSCLFRW